MLIVWIIIIDELVTEDPPNFVYFWYSLPPMFYCILNKEFSEISKICTFDTSLNHKIFKNRSKSPKICTFDTK